MNIQQLRYVEGYLLIVERFEKQMEKMYVSQPFIHFH